MPTYRYTGDVPTVFISMRKDGRTWVPDKGDEIEWPEQVGHPFLEVVSPEKPAAPESPVNTESPVAVDGSKEN
jgi:hypothetical protein